MIEKQLRALVKNRDRRIAELEAEVDGKDLLIEDLNHQIDGFKELEAEVKALREAADRVVLPSIQECKNLAALLQDEKGKPE